MTPDGCDVVQRRTITHDSPPDGPRSPKFNHRKSSYGVVKAGVTVAEQTYSYRSTVLVIHEGLASMWSRVITSYVVHNVHVPIGLYCVFS